MESKKKGKGAMINRRAPVPVAFQKMTARRSRSNLIKIGDRPCRKNNMLLFFLPVFKPKNA
jgi:hypothetical protein